MRVIIDSFSGALADLPAKKRGDGDAVLRLLAKSPVFSVFDATQHQKLAVTLDRLQQSGCIVRDDAELAFPWCRVKLTDKGLARIATNQGEEHGPV